MTLSTPPESGKREDADTRASIAAPISEPVAFAPCGCKWYADGTAYACLSHRELPLAQRRLSPMGGGPDPNAGRAR